MCHMLWLVTAGVVFDCCVLCFGLSLRTCPDYSSYVVFLLMLQSFVFLTWLYTLCIETGLLMFVTLWSTWYVCVVCLLVDLFLHYMFFLPAGVISLCDCFFKYFCVFEFQLVAYVLYMCFSPYFVCLFACSSVVLHVVFSLFLVVRLFRVCSQQFLLICAVCWQFSNHHRCF